MPDKPMPWYVKGVIGVGAWVTAIVLMLLGGAIVFMLFKFERPAPLIGIGLAYLGFGLWLVRQSGRGLFADQLAIATAAAGVGLVAGGIAAELESLWIGFSAAVVLAALVAAVTASRTLQFLASAIAAALYIAALIEAKTPYFVDFAALATPVGLWLLLRPPKLDLLPTALVLLLVFPVFTVGAMDQWRWLGAVASGGTFAKALHIVLFLGLVYLHWRNLGEREARAQVAGFAVIATLVCLLLPPGGSAAMLLIMLGFVIGSRPIALIGVALQVHYIIRYYYFLQVTLLNKSLLLMAVGVLLLAAWWLARRGDAARSRS